MDPIYFAIQRHTAAARARTGRPSISTRVKQGQVQIVDVTYPNGSRSVVAPLSDWMPATDVPAALDGLDARA
jgi:hypothetical protein